MKNKVFEYYNDTYEVTVFLIVSTPTYCKKWLKENLNVSDEATYKALDGRHSGVTFEFSDAPSNGRVVCHVIYLPEFESNPDNLATLVHEIFHVCVNILLARDIPIERDNNEPMAYLMSAMTKHFLKKTRITYKREKHDRNKH
jgi:hypothetical protein